MRQAARAAAMFVCAFVVALLPGTTSATTPARLAYAAELPEALQDGATAVVSPILVPVTLAQIWSASPVDPTLEPPASIRPPGPPASIFESTLVVSVYGHPGFCVMGELGCHDDPHDAVESARALAQEYEAVSEGLTVLPALHLIVDVAQARPGSDGLYLERMPLSEVEAWVEVARKEEVLLFLDIQVGLSDVVEGVERLMPFLAEPFVHLAIDPEFATAGRGAPGAVIGTLGAEDVNAVQTLLAGLVTERALPPKALVLHQFRPDMLTDPESFEDVPEVEIVIDMDGWGPPWPKRVYYERYALAKYAEVPAIKLFEHWDEPLMTPADVMGLLVPPSYVIYQ